MNELTTASEAQKTLISHLLGDERN